MKLFNILICILTFLLLCSCSRTVYVPVESKAVSLSADSLERLVSAMAMSSMQSAQVESIYIKESATYTINEHGDTTKTIIEREKDSSKEWRTKEAYYLAVIDSLSQKSARVDSVYIEKPLPVETVREVHSLLWWQKALCWVGGISLLLVIIFLARWFKRR